MILICDKCKTKNRLPSDGNPDKLGRPVCARCGSYLFPQETKNNTHENNATENVQKSKTTNLKNDGSTNIIGISKAGLSFVEFIISNEIANKNCTMVFNEYKRLNIPPEVNDVFSAEHAAYLDYENIAEVQNTNHPTIVVLGAAGKFASDAAIRLSENLKLLKSPISYILIGPHDFEGLRREQRAKSCLEALKANSDKSIMLSVNDLSSNFNPKATFDDAHAEMNLKILTTIKDISAG